MQKLLLITKAKIVYTKNPNFIIMKKPLEKSASFSETHSSSKFYLQVGIRDLIISKIITMDPGRRRKFDGGERESWPLPPSSVFKCRTATPWVDPDLFYSECSNLYMQFKSGAVVLGETFLEESETEDVSYDNDYGNESIYSELEKYSATKNKLDKASKPVIQYSDNPERGIDPGTQDDYRGDRRASLNNLSQTKLEPAHAELSTSNALGDEGRHRSVNVNVANQERSRNENVLPRFKVESDETTISSGGSGTRKKKKWSPFQKTKTQSWNLF